VKPRNEHGPAGSSPPGRHAEIAIPDTAATLPPQEPAAACIVTDGGNGGGDLCGLCGAVADPRERLRQLLAERHEAWKAGCRLSRDARRDAELAAFYAGWEQGVAAGLERGRAA